MRKKTKRDIIYTQLNICMLYIINNTVVAKKNISSIFYSDFNTNTLLKNDSSKMSFGQAYMTCCHIVIRIRLTIDI